MVAEVERRHASPGRGECVPYARYGETVEGVRDAILAMRGALADRARLLAADAGRRRPQRARLRAVGLRGQARPARRPPRSPGLAPLRPLTTAYTISLDTAEAMAAKAAAAARTMPLLKLKLGGAGDAERLRAGPRRLPRRAPDRRCQRGLDAGAAARADGGRRRDRRRADRAAAARRRRCGAGRPARGARVRRRMRCTTAPASPRSPAATTPSTSSSTRPAGSPRRWRWRARPRARGFRIMVGCMVATSLAMAPALLLAQGADWVDLDGPLLLARDRDAGAALRRRARAPARAGAVGLSALTPSRALPGLRRIPD